MTPAPAGAPPETISRALPSLEATHALGCAIARLLHAGDVVALWGDLGAGKTALARVIIGALGYAGEVPSPTFTLVQTYDVAPAAVWHFDLYRIGHADETIELGLEEALAEAITLIEWPERLAALLPADRLDVVLSYAGDHARRAELQGHGGWRDRIAALQDDR